VPASVPWYHELRTQIGRHCPEADLPVASAERLALLVTGLIAAQSCVLAKVAAQLDALALTAALWAESIERRLRRALADPHLTAEVCYTPVLATAIDWRRAHDHQGRIVVIIDESSKRDRIHLFRVSLPYRGGSLPVAWAVWRQNEALAAGAYWAQVDAVLARVAALLPVGAEAVAVADRADAVPALIDRLQGHGWHWVLRLTTTGSHRFWPDHGPETGVRDLVARHLPRPGRRWRAQGRLFKDAGWRPARLVGIWGHGAKEPLVVATDLPAKWTVLTLYDRRFWIEPGFRADKTRGWQWESSQVRGVAHHAVLLLALALATLVVPCLGAGQADRRVRHLAGQPPRRHGARCRTAKPQPAGESLFTLGLRQAQHWLRPTRRRLWRWHLPEVAAPSWTAHWRALQSHRFVFGAPVRS
jgi:hypothetical protein